MNYMFFHTTRLKAMDMSLWQVRNVTSMVSMFKKSESLREVRLPPSLLKIDAGIFAGCQSLNDVAIPAGVTIIAEKAFFGCIALRTFSIPKSVVEIAPTAFGSTFCCPSATSSVCRIYAAEAVCDCKECSATTTTAGNPGARSTATRMPPTETIAPTKAAPLRDPKRNVTTHILIAVIVVGAFASAVAVAMHRFKARRLERALIVANGPSGKSFLTSYDSEMTGLMGQQGAAEMQV
jgi:hypothetical protein